MKFGGGKHLELIGSSVGIRNTSFFHSKATWGAKKNKVEGLLNMNGGLTEDPKEMEQITNSFFQQLYEKDTNVRPE